ncbi:hypothetical protein [Pseudonocardia sp. NPDC049154]|uniref:hypothetical protein n=1 Tax=Pseudonocardia sp. NPDC049154 TaxID=3155501 RepID=UPI00340C83AF
MTIRSVAQAHYERMQQISGAAAAVAVREWKKLPPGDWEAAYVNTIGPQALAALILGQLASADEADGYVADMIDAIFGGDRRSAGEGRIDPEAFAGEAADGRPLDTLMYMPVQRAQIALRRGASLPEALDIGEKWLATIVATEVTDAGRVADGVAITSRPVLTGYVRMLTPPSCGRCAVLAGRVYKWNAGFERHPNCDCRHVPFAEDTLDDLRTDPRAAVLAGKVTGLSKADEQAIRDGADVGQVINAHRGMYTAGGRKFTTEGTTRRGLAHSSFRAQTGRKIRQRLRPEQIYKEAGGDRAEAIRLLTLHGYIF